MRTTSVIRTGLTALVLGLAACSEAPLTEEPAGAAEPPPPPVVDTARRDRPVFHVVDVGGERDYYVYTAYQGRVVMTVEPGVGLRPASPSEIRFALDRFEAWRADPRTARGDAYADLLRAERAARGDISSDLVALMERSVRQWEEEKRNLEIKREAARMSGGKEDEAQVGQLIAALERRILAHQIKIQLYTSPEWKAGRPTPNAGATLRSADASK